MGETCVSKLQKAWKVLKIGALFKDVKGNVEGKLDLA